MEHLNKIDYIEIDLNKKELELLKDYNNLLAQKFEIDTPKICIEHRENGAKYIYIMHDKGFYGMAVYKTQRKQRISENEAHRKTQKYLKILLGRATL